MKIFIVGGTGLLGSAGAKELIKRGHYVEALALPPMPEGADIPKEMMIHWGNLINMQDEDIKRMLKGFDGLVFAAGVDERVEFHPPVYDSYKKYNIEPLQRLLPIAKECGVKKVVILGSYFSYFAKIWKELDLYNTHPYIRSRIDQENLALSFYDEKMQVMVLELPYIFGAQKGRKPVWTFIIKMILDAKKKVYYPKGGTTMVTVNQVGQAIAGGIERGKGGRCYPVGWYNLSWVEMLNTMIQAMGLNKKVATIPTWIFKIAYKSIAKGYKKRNIESGLNPVPFVKIMTANTFIDRGIIERELGVQPDDIYSAIGESATYCMEIINKDKEVVEMKAE